jgi:hypothetical protein
VEHDIVPAIVNLHCRARAHPAPLTNRLLVVFLLEPAVSKSKDDTIRRLDVELLDVRTCAPLPSVATLRIWTSA